jgi:hypothetical protein
LLLLLPAHAHALLVPPHQQALAAAPAADTSRTTLLD